MGGCQRGPASDPFLHRPELMGRCQAEVSTGKIQARVSWQGSQTGNVDLVEHGFQQLAMALAGHAIEHDPRQVHAWLQSLETAYHGRQGSGLSARIHHQHHRQIQMPGDSSCAPFGAGSDAVVQTHHAFDDGHVAESAETTEAEIHPVVAAEGQVEVPADPAGTEAEKLGSR